MAGLMTHVNYISDDGNTYRLRMDASNATAAGNATATSTVRLPSGYEPRYILATEPVTGRERKIVVCDPAVDLWTGGTASITIEDYRTSPSAQVAHGVFSRVGEKRLNR